MSGADMQRREFLVMMGGSLATWPTSARAQEPGRVYRIGCLFPFPRNAPPSVAFFEGLARLGFVEGQNLVVEFRGYGQNVDRISSFVMELVDARVDVIVVGGDPAIRAAQQATKTIPILGFTDDMVGSGLVNSLARSGGNTTGVSILATELDGKRQELLLEAVPGLRRMAALADTGTTAVKQLQALQDAARTSNVELTVHAIAKPAEIIAAIDAAKASGAAALNVLASPILFGNRQIILERVALLRLPTIYQWPETAEEGGFVGYGPRIIQLFRDLMTRQLVKILRGAKPADLPIEQPTKFELVINLRTAKALGIEVPPAILARADEVIE
jgi:putative tryptophan/tyrosine transport system substrate-binding protein